MHNTSYCQTIMLIQLIVDLYDSSNHSEFLCKTSIQLAIGFDHSHQWKKNPTKYFLAFKRINQNIEEEISNKCKHVQTFAKDGACFKEFSRREIVNFCTWSPQSVMQLRK